MTSAFLTGLYPGSYLGGVRSNGYYGGGYASTRVATDYDITRAAKKFTRTYSDDFNSINYYIQTGEVDQAMSLYKSVMQRAKQDSLATYYNLSDDDIKSALNDAYTSNSGESFIETIKNETSGSFATGFKQGVPVIGLFVDGKSTDEVIADYMNTNVSKKKADEEVTGAALSGTLLGGAAGWGTVAFCDAAATVIGTALGCSVTSSVVPVAGTVIGAAIGLGIGLYQVYRNQNK